ncbi:hypothetical protein ATKI12_5452 [Kitasatospora sp. Ki12]
MGDPALQPILDLPSVEQHHDELGNFFAFTTDGRIRVGFIPEQDWDTLWKIAVAPGADAFEAPRWVANFSTDTPIEIVKSVTTELARMYRTDGDTWLDERTAGPLEWVAPFAQAEWTPQGVDLSRLTLRSPDGLASITYRRAGLLHTADTEQAGQDGRFNRPRSESRPGAGPAPARLSQRRSNCRPADISPFQDYRSHLSTVRRTARHHPIRFSSEKDYPA